MYTCKAWKKLYVTKQNLYLRLTLFAIFFNTQNIDMHDFFQTPGINWISDEPFDFEERWCMDALFVKKQQFLRFSVVDAIYLRF